MPNLSTITEELAAQIKGGRDKAHLTQDEFADLLGVSKRTVQNWEAGAGFPRAKHRRLLAAFLKDEEEAA